MTAPRRPRKRRNFLVPTLSTAVMLAVLLGLGVWQLRRLAWKEGILAAIAAAEAAPPVALPAAPTPFEKIVVHGRYLPVIALYGADVRETARGPTMGGQLLQVLVPAEGPPLLVARGWIPDGALAAFAEAAPAVSVTGFVRLPARPGWFTPRDDPGRLRFYTLDPARIGAALGLKTVAPFTLMAMGAPPPGGIPAPAESLPRPPNNHLSYALTWFGLAIVLAVIYGLWLRRHWRQEGAGGDE
ncbi:MAG: SURF1 family protein [Acidibrevibacterium sp.]|uniref:SURF1 family protein n=1 Tax=Acidibrevibacterium fodinaquatile TaxID=1969806 RepID=UPI0023A7C80B|nr:SURF1 family cytochrome oxidase biogenesis protein [Acidibrevibacterium fodinaquatile]MCA7119992.1 SURF1 family protein [Acidibrevibacterium fodinaquatile]